MTATGSHALVRAAPPHDRSWRYFGRHYLEMVLAMVVGMAVLGGAISLVLALAGLSGLRDHTEFRAPVMALDMAVGMAVWMRYRGHRWGPVAEMSLAMLVPAAVLFGPFLADLISGGALLLWMHVLMLPAMALVMLRRLDEYAVDHRRHAAGGRLPDLRAHAH